MGVGVGGQTASRIGALAHTQPDQLLQVAGDGATQVCGAVWSHAPATTQVTGLPQHALVLHMAGSTLVEKWSGGRLLGHRSRIGSVSLVPAQVASTWVLSGHSRVAHVYVSPSGLEQAAQAVTDGAAASGALADFFAEADAGTAQLMRLLLAHAAAGTLDRLTHDDIMALLMPQLLRRFAVGAPVAGPSPRITLTSATLRRLFEYIDNRLATDIRLADLAALARLSNDHFLRAFKLAVGQTPHQYVVGRRLGQARRLLGSTTQPVAAIATATGFGGASHFAAAFRQHHGVSPSHWRLRQGLSAS